MVERSQAQMVEEEKERPVRKLPPNVNVNPPQLGTDLSDPSKRMLRLAWMKDKSCVSIGANNMHLKYKGISRTPVDNRQSGAQCRQMLVRAIVFNKKNYVDQVKEAANSNSEYSIASKSDFALSSKRKTPFELNEDGTPKDDNDEQPRVLYVASKDMPDDELERAIEELQREHEENERAAREAE